MIGHQYDQMLSTWKLEDTQLVSPDGRFRLHTARGFEGFRDTVIYEERRHGTRELLIKHEPAWKRYKLYRAVKRRVKAIRAYEISSARILDIEAGIAPKGQMVEHLLTKGK